MTSTNGNPTVRKAMPRAVIVMAAFLAVAVSAPLAQAKTHLRISATAAAIDGYENWTSSTVWTDIQNFKNANASRPVVDLLLELQALKVGGLDFDFELVRTPTYELAKTAVIEGSADLSAETIWGAEIDSNADKLLKTDAVIRDGEFVKGIYVLPSDAEHLKISTLDDLRGCVGVVVSSWALDVKSMEELKLKGIVKTVTPDLAFLQIQKHAADFTLAEFSASPDMHVELRGVVLVPVPKRTVAIRGSRSWIVSKSSADADSVFKALEAGTIVLRNNGTIERAYKESGFLNPKVSDWTRLN
jgi:hypothetical protein